MPLKNVTANVVVSNLHHAYDPFRINAINIIKSTKNRPNKNLEIDAATEDTPLNPNSPVTSEMTKNTNAQYNILLPSNLLHKPTMANKQRLPR